MELDFSLNHSLINIIYTLHFQGVLSTSIGIAKRGHLSRISKRGNEKYGKNLLLERQCI